MLRSKKVPESLGQPRQYLSQILARNQTNQFQLRSCVRTMQFIIVDHEDLSGFNLIANIADHVMALTIDNIIQFQTVMPLHRSYTLTRDGGMIMVKGKDFGSEKSSLSDVWFIAPRRVAGRDCDNLIHNYEAQSCRENPDPLFISQHLTS